MSGKTDEATRWLAAAREELAWARYATKGEFHAPACFHAQQAAEKAVKAVHFHRGARAVLGHSVRRLIETLADAPSELDALREAARELDLFYIPTRYPNGLESGTPGEAFGPAQSERALDHASKILAAVESIIARSLPVQPLNGP